MDYAVKLIIGGVEALEAADMVTNSDNVTYQPPWVSAVTLYDNGTSGTMQIGATPSDKLTFTLNAPHKQNFDGEVVELWVSPPDEEADDMAEMSVIEDEVEEEEDKPTEGIDEDEVTNEMEDEDDGQGETPTEEEIETSDEEQEVNINDRFVTFEGEDDTIVDEETDEGEEPDWFRIGIFYVHSQKTTTDRKAVMLTCYDTMQMLTGTFTPSSATATIQTMFDDLRTQVLAEYGVIIDAFDYDTFATESIAWSWDVSYREALGWFAGLMGGYATCGDDGSIGFSIYSYQDGLYLDTALNWFNVDPSSEVEIDGIRCNIGGLGEKYLESGDEPDITFSNPLMTQDILDDILATYRGVHFFGGSMSMGWDSSLHAGNLVRVMTASEYRNYTELQYALADPETPATDIPMIKDSINNLGTVMLVGQQVVDFNGDANATIYSNSASVTATAAARPTLTEVATGAAATAKATNQYFWHTQTDTGAGAGAHVTEIPREDFLDDPENGGGNVLLTSTGMDVRDGTDVLATFGTETSIYTTSGTELAHFGYGPGTNSTGGTSDAPYYTLGIRKTTSQPYNASNTYSIGDLCVYNDVVYICTTNITTPEAWDSTHWQNAIGNYSVAEGYNTEARGCGAHAEGFYTTAASQGAHAEGNNTTAASHGAHAEGDGTIASSGSAHAEGSNTKASGWYAHAEGSNTRALDYYSHAEGYLTEANGPGVHAEGRETIASGLYSHAEGYGTITDYTGSHAQNIGTIATKQSQTSLGSFNVEDTAQTTTHPSGEVEYGQYAVIVGNGTDDNSRSNALTVDWSGNVEASGYVSGKRETVYDNASGWTPSTSTGTTVDGKIANYSLVEVHLSDGSFGVCNLSWSNGTGVILGMLSYPYNDYIYVNSINFQLTPSGSNYTLLVPSAVQMPANYRIGTSVLKVTTVRKLTKIVGLVSTHE